MAIAVPWVGRECPSREAAGRMPRHSHNRDRKQYTPARRGGSGDASEEGSPPQ